MRTNIVFVSALLLGTNPGFAEMIVQSKGVGLTDVGSFFSVPVEFNPFDPALGTLTSVTLNLSASFSGTVGVENLSSSPDLVTGFITGSVTVSTTDNSLSVEVFPSAEGPQHNLAPYQGVTNFAAPSGATDTVSGLDQSAGVTAPPPASALESFIGDQQIFLALTATSFAIVQGQQTETATETANASALVQLTYNYTPVPEPGTLALGTIGFASILGMRRWRRTRRNL